MDVFYRQKKKSSTSAPERSTKNPSHKDASATFGSLVSVDLKDDFDEEEQLLRQFDMNMAYGPCLGMSRLARWERAQRMGLNPPEEIGSLLKGGKERLECLFEGRV